MKKPSTGYRLAAGLAGLALVAAACGADDGDTAAEETTAPTTAEETTEATDGETGVADPGDEAGEAEDDAEAGEGADGRPVLELSFSGLEPLGADFDYEGWVVVDGEAISTGVFDIAEDGSIEADGPFYAEEGAEAVVISIEPADDPDPAPAATKVLGGAVNDDGTFELGIDFEAALGTDFSDAAGQFILGTPTDDPDGNELSGVWFLSVPGPEQSLELPALPDGWVYEGWAVIDGQPISTGRFTDPAGPDDLAIYSGPNEGPPYPGEDFIVNAPDGLEFPTTLIGSTIVISVEPDADNSPAPFALKPLVAEVAEGTGDHENLDFGAGPVDISGSGSISG